MIVTLATLILFLPQSITSGTHDLSGSIYSIYGAGSCAEWAAEGRRLVPLMPRLVPQTVFSASATAAANSAAAANAKVLVSSGNAVIKIFSTLILLFLQ